MRSFDLSPLFRSSIGFDRLHNLLETSLKEDVSSGYPPYNIGKIDDNKYFITMALAGFKPEDVNIKVQKNLLTVSANVSTDPKEEITYLYKGIATRSFERKFSLVDYMRVEDASMVDGVLTIELIREIPEEIKPKQISINSNRGNQPKVDKK
ncbi:MAG: Hsp20 family protein [Rickettsiales endosymbiont of Dermacentor nuttalli]